MKAGSIIKRSTIEWREMQKDEIKLDKGKNDLINE